MPSLRLTTPGHPPTVYHLYKKITSIGSGPENDIVLPDPLVADSYASIHFDGQVYTITTLARRSDVIVNGKKRGKHKLTHQDRLVIGSAELRFAMMDEEPPAEVEAAATISDLDAYVKLFEFSEKLMQKRDLGELLEALMDSIIEITNADKGFLILTEGDSFDIKVARNVKRENIADAVSQLSDSIIAKVVKTRRPVIISDAMHDDEFAAAKSVMQLRVSSVICVPLLDRGRLLGLIYIGNDSIRSLFQEETMRLVTIFAAQASLIVANALLVNELRLDNRRLHERLEQYRFGEIVGTSAPMQQVFRKVEKIAATDISVLITGETGTGKELIAREIHQRSPRVGKPFITINCGAIPENLLESELFGHVKGAFTGAIAAKQGKFQAADGGTLFLDEIGEMVIELQVKLLRALQERVVFRVGDTRAESVDIRVVTATNRELENRIKKAIVLAESTVIGPDDLGLSADNLPAILTLAEAKDKFQREYINEVLAVNNGNRTKTARDLGVDPRTIFRHLEKEGGDGEPASE